MSPTPGPHTQLVCHVPAVCVAYVLMSIKCLMRAFLLLSPKKFDSLKACLYWGARFECFCFYFNLFENGREIFWQKCIFPFFWLEQERAKQCPCFPWLWPTCVQTPMTSQSWSTAPGSNVIKPFWSSLTLRQLKLKCLTRWHLALQPNQMFVSKYGAKP
jgi:hypothetical protein